MNRTFNAPWGRPLKTISVLVTLFCLGAFVMAMIFHPASRPGSTFSPEWVGYFPVILLMACLPFVVRSYTITADAILIRRLFWDTRIDREGLVSAEFIEGAMSGSLRTFGNGGAFSFTGWYWNRKLGFYRAYVTDTRATVVLRFVKRSIVISPGHPEEFVAALGLERALNS